MQGGLNIFNTGFLGLVQASGDFAPPDSANLVFWGRADSLAGADADPIASFTDRSGLGNHATATSGKQPLLKKNILNTSHSVLRFDGSDDFMTWPDILSGVSAGEVFIVLKADAEPAAAGTYSLWYLSKTNAVGEAAHPFTNSLLFEHFGSDAQVAAFSKPTTTAAFHQYGVEIAANKMVVRFNGDIIWGQNKNSPGFNTAPLLCRNTGNTAVWKGDIAEIFIYKAVQSTANKKLIHDYLAARYGLTIADPTAVITPASYASGFSGWWKADSLALNNNDPVASWADSSGNSRTLTQSTGSLKPVFKTSAFNGQPAIEFDGVDDYLGLAASHNISGVVTFMAVFKQFTGFDNARIFAENGDQQTKVRRGGANAMNFYAGSGTEVVSGTSWNYSTLDTLNFYVWRRNADNTISFFQNGVEINTPGSTTNTTYPFNKIGVVFGGRMCELCYWTTALNNYDIAKLYYQYFRDKWGLV